MTTEHFLPGAQVPREETIPELASEDTLNAILNELEKTGVYRTDQMPVPGIGAAAAYAAGDAFGTKFSIAAPREGVISTVVFLDLDDEGIEKDIVVFSGDFAATTDNDAFAVADSDLLKCVGYIKVNAYANFANNQVGVATPALAYKAPLGRLWFQIVTRGADNIAAGSEPQLSMVIL